MFYTPKNLYLFQFIMNKKQNNKKNANQNNGNQNRTHKTLTIAHLINTFNCPKDHPSYLYYAVPITIETMRLAKGRAKSENIDVKLCSITFPEDADTAPDDFIKLPHLNNSTTKLYGKKANGIKLPLFREMFKKFVNNVKADYYVITNNDIGLQPYFYKKIGKMIRNKGFDSINITRRNRFPKFRKIIDSKTDEKTKHRLTANKDDLEYLFAQKGVKHPGNDCFVISRHIMKKLKMGNLYPAFSPWGIVLTKQMSILSKKYKKIRQEHLTFHIGEDKMRKQEKTKFLRIQNIINARNVF